MSDKTVRQLAAMVKTPVEQLLKQLKEAGLSVRNADDIISEDEQMQLLTHLRKSHGKTSGETDSSPKRVTLKRRKVTEIKQANVPGSSTKTISVEVRKEKTYIKRPDSEEKKPVEIPKPEPIVETKVEPIIETQVEIVTEVIEPVETTLKTVETGSEPVAVVEEIPASVKVEAKTEPKKPHKPNNHKKPKVELDESIIGADTDADDTDLEADAQARFEALKVKEEKKSKQEKSVKTKDKEAEEARKKQQEKERRLEESIKRNAEKVRQQAAKSEARKSQEEGSRSGGGGGKDNKKNRKKGKQQSQTPQRPVIQFEGKHQFEMPVAPIIYDVTVPESIIVSDLAQKMNIKAAAVIKQLMKLGMMATINQAIDQETAVILVEEMGHRAIMQSDDDLEQEMLAQ
ncbi:partial Translation initiation factor IF-2, partial [Patescibacteria group bacterium]